MSVRRTRMQEIGQLAYKVVADEDGAAQIVCSAAEDGALYPEEVSAHVLLRLIDAVQKETGCEVDRAVISVPAYFSEAQQEATIAAGVPKCIHPCKPAC
jgi:molecular chaperone DnaK (HSP70)